MKNYLAGTVGLIVSAGALAAGTLVLADGRVTSGIITLLCAAACAVTAICNFIVAARMRALTSLAKRAEEQSTQVRGRQVVDRLPARESRRRV